MEKIFHKLCVAGSTDDTGEKLLLHGVIDITIGQLKFESLSSSLWADLHDHRGGCHVDIKLPPVTVARTQAQENHKGKVVWQETLRIYSAHKVSALVMSLNGHGYKGEAHISAFDIVEKRIMDDWFNVVHNIHNVGKLHVVMKFVAANEDPLWGAGVGDPENFAGVPNTNFPLHKGCRVTPFQNSHVEDDFLPLLALPGDRQYQPGKYWHDLQQAILDAKHFIYIAGWSVFADISLVRSNYGDFAEESLQKLLIERADDGVSVLVMIWDDKTNNLDGLISKEGMMRTHDEDTHVSFQGSNVKVFRCPRNPKGGAFHLVDGLAFTHHQKAVVLDAPELDNGAATSYGLTRRRLVSFVGGIDLCDGRYDTPTHSLFRTLNTVHSRDFHQECLPGANIEQGGPRQPWHDIHSKLEGAVAWDVYTNFTQRWALQAKDEFPDLLVDFTKHENFCPPSPVLDEHDPAAWNVQLFRSIDSSSVDLCSDPEHVLKTGLTRDHDLLVDRSIQDAYICAIRRAKRYLFIENQYFMGSSFAWRDEPAWEASISNLIPIEIALKISSKIRAGQDSLNTLVNAWNIIK